MGESKIVRKGGKGGEPIPPTPTLYISATGGTIEEYDLNDKRYRSHTFTSNGTFEVTQLSDIEDFNKVDYLVIAGGASGGNSGGSSGASHTAGGGGAGGYRTTLGTQGGLGVLDPKVVVTETTYEVTVGAGGASIIDANFSFSGSFGNSGSNSEIAFPTTITSLGGGGGAGRATFRFGRDGGSGGGAGGSTPNVNFRGLGSINQGFPGGKSTTGSSAGGGGGGGAGSVGGNGSGTTGGNGGAGLASIIRDGETEEIRAGGGGAARSSGATIGGGGFAGSPNGVDNTGGGGLGTPGGNSGAGGSGIVIIRYEIAPN